MAPDAAAYAGRVVLVADNLPKITELLEAFLRKTYRGLEVVRATSGREAMDVVRARRVDVAILDRHIGDADGLRLLMRLDADGFPGARVLMSAYGELPLDRRGLGLVGLDAFVRKPFDLLAFAHLLGFLLSSTPARRAEARALGAFELAAADAPRAEKGVRAAEPPARYCRNGHANGPGMKFCGECGHPLRPLEAPPAGREFDPALAEAYAASLRDDPDLAARFRRAAEED